MSYSQTTASFAGGVEGANVPGAIATAPVAGVGTTYVAGTTPVVNGGLYLTNGQTGQTAVALPVTWPFSAPIVVSNTGAATSLLFPGAATQQINGTTAGNSYSVAVGKSVLCFYVGPNLAGAGQWVVVGA